MKLKNYELQNINFILSGLLEQKTNGVLAYKLFKIGFEIANLLIPVNQAIEGLEEGSEERKSILDEEREVNVELLTVEDISPLNLSMFDIKFLSPILEGLNKEETDELQDNE